MPKEYYLPRRDEEKATWLQNFVAKLAVLADKYGITPQEIMEIQNDAILFLSILQYNAQLGTHQKAFVEFKDLVRDGAKGMTSIDMPAFPVPMFGGPIVPGIFARCTALVARIKAHPNYNVADGNNLGIEGTEITVDYNGLKPDIKLRLGSGGHPETLWKKGKLDGIEIHKEDANGNLQLLAVDTRLTFWI